MAYRTHNFRELKIWQLATELSYDIYQLTAIFPRNEMFGLTNQLRRAVNSISANIAEGCGRGTDAQLVNFLSIAQGSAFETESHLYLAKQLDFIKEDKLNEVNAKLQELQKMIAAFQRKFETK